MQWRISRRTALVAVIVVFSVAAALHAWFFALSFPDETEYWTLATNLARTGTFSYDGVTPSAYRPPLVPWLLTPFTAAGLSINAARLFFVLFFAATGALAAWFLIHAFPTSLAVPLIGTAFVLSHPLYFFSAGNLYPQQVLTPLLIAALMLASIKPRSQRAALLRVTAIGVLTAVSLLASAPAVFALLPIFVLLVTEDWQALRARQPSRAWQAVLASVVVMMCVAPYVARNVRHVHRNALLSLNSGLNLLLGNAPQTTATSGSAVDISAFRSDAMESEYERNRRYTQAAIKNMRNDPAHYTALYFEKFAFGFTHTVATITHGFNARATLAMRAYMALVWIGTAAVFIALSRHRADQSAALFSDETRRFACLALVAYVLSLSGYALFFTRLRFRMPQDVALAVVAIAGWALVWEWFARRRGLRQD